MRDSGQIEQLARGLYRLADMPSLSQSDLVTVAAKSPQAVIYLVSALSFTADDTNPHEVWIAILEIANRQDWSSHRCVHHDLATRRMPLG